MAAIYPTLLNDPTQDKKASTQAHHAWGQAKPQRPALQTSQAEKHPAHSAE